MSDITYPQFDQIAAPQLAVDCQVEEREVAQVLSQLQADADRPDLLKLQGRLLANELAPVLGAMRRSRCVRRRVHDELLFAVEGRSSVGRRASPEE